MFKRTYLAIVMSLSLILVSIASVSMAAGGGSGHVSHPHAEMTMEEHHQMSATADIMDCPAHHDGHTMKDAQCAVACFAMISAVGWNGMIFTPLAVIPGQEVVLDTQFYKTRTLHIPTPPPNFA